MLPHSKGEAKPYLTVLCASRCVDRESRRLSLDAEGIPWIEQGTINVRATGAILALTYYLGLKAEALHMAGRTSEALEAIKVAEALAERSEERWWWAELQRLRGVFLAALGC